MINPTESPVLDHQPDPTDLMTPQGKTAPRTTSTVPRRISIVQQTTAIIRHEIESGTWSQWLPSERSLSADLGISRPTLRLALKHLQDYGLVEPVQGIGNRIHPSAPRDRPQQADNCIRLLCPDPIDRMRLQSNLWIEDVRSRLAQNGGRLIIHQSMQFLRKRPEPSLKRLVEQNPAGAWILAHSSHAVQSWFEREKVPSIVAGYTHQGINLPYAMIDMEATCRHAAGTLIRLGHRRLGLIIREMHRAGDALSAKGFLDGVAQSSESGIRAEIANHQGDTESICRAVHRLVRRSSPVTAILVGSARNYVTVATCLMCIGLRIPEDVSLISREDDPFLNAIVPSPAHYVFTPSEFAANVYQLAVAIANREVPSADLRQLIPQYREGNSVQRLS